MWAVIVTFSSAISPQIKVCKPRSLRASPGSSVYIMLSGRATACQKRARVEHCYKILHQGNFLRGLTRLTLSNNTSWTLLLPLLDISRLGRLLSCSRDKLSKRHRNCTGRSCLNRLERGAENRQTSPLKHSSALNNTSRRNYTSNLAPLCQCNSVVLRVTAPGMRHCRCIHLHLCGFCLVKLLPSNLGKLRRSCDSAL